MKAQKRLMMLKRGGWEEYFPRDCQAIKNAVYLIAKSRIKKGLQQG